MGKCVYDVSVKRPSIEAPAGGQKNEVKRYAPPTGKFSDRTGACSHDSYKNLLMKILYYK